LLWFLALSAFFYQCDKPADNSEHLQNISEEVESEGFPHDVTYEIFVQSFYDADGDGIGDLPGLTSKLDYLDELGVGAVWLMPIMPSPSYHKYDVINYKDIHPDYGTIEDFQTFVEEAHNRDIKVIIDFIINHTYKGHPWFQESKKGAYITDESGIKTENPFRDYYVWKTREEIEAEGSFTKQEQSDSDNIVQWYEVEGQEELYYGYFGSHMPDINYDNEEAKTNMFEIGKWWLTEMNIDGFRLDAAKHIFDHYPKKNHRFWVEFREAMESVKPDVYLVGEVWDEAEKVAPYLKGLPALFNFDMGTAIIKAVNQGGDTTLVEKYKEINDYYTSITEDFIDATFLRNHDQTRVRNEFNGGLEKSKIAASVLLTFPGSPFLYYGEEIGMLGAKPGGPPDDPFVREPFIWSENDPGQASWMEPRYSTAETVRPLDQQVNDENSIYNHYMQLLEVRKQSDVLRLGEIIPTEIVQYQVVDFVREFKGESLLILHNLSDASVEVALPEKLQDYNKHHFTNKEGFSMEGAIVNLPGYSTLILARE